MKIQTTLLTCCAVLAVSQLPSLAQVGTTPNGLYQFSFNGTSSTTDSTGKIVNKTITQNDLLQEYAKQNNVNDTSGLAIAYHFNGNSNGDTIDVVNRQTAAVVHTLIGLYFGEAFGRMELVSTSKRQIKHLEYIYTDQNDHSLGSSLITDYIWYDTGGKTNGLAFFGNLQYLVTPNNVHSNVEVISGNFTAFSPMKFP